MRAEDNLIYSTYKY